MIFTINQSIVYCSNAGMFVLEKYNEKSSEREMNVCRLIRPRERVIEKNQIKNMEKNFILHDDHDELNINNIPNNKKCLNN